MGQFGCRYFHGYVTVRRTPAGENDDVIFTIPCNAVEGGLKKYVEMMQDAMR